MRPSDPTPQTWGDDVVDGDFAEVPPEKVDEAQWLKDLDGAFSGCEDVISLGQKQEQVMAPQKGKVSDASWTAATKTLTAHFQRLTSGTRRK